MLNKGKAWSLIVFIIFFGLNTKAQKNDPADSTITIINEWITAIKDSNYVYQLSIRGGKNAYDSNLKLITESLNNYQEGKYSYAFQDANDIKKVERIPEVNRIKLFLMTMSEIKLNQRFKARKWYYISKKTTSESSFIRLQKNVERLKLSYNIDNYKKIKGRRTTALIISGGVLVIVNTVASVFSE